MDMTEHTQDRLSFVARPWGQSLAYLGTAAFVTFLSFEAHRADEALAMQWVVTASAILLWSVFFIYARRSEITFDRRSGHLRIAQQKMFGRTGVIIPISVITAVRAERVAPLRRWPWQYRITLTSRAGDFGATAYLVEGLFGETEATRAADKISAWLDSPRAAA